MAESERFGQSLAFYMSLLDMMGVSRARVCERAKLSRNVITNIVNNATARPAYDTVIALVEAINAYGVKPAWDVNKALEEAGWRESVAVTAPREIVDVPPYPMATMNLPIYNADDAGRQGITIKSYKGTVNLDSSYIVLEGMVPLDPSILTLVQTIGDFEDGDILLVRRVDVAAMAFMTAKAAEDAGHILLGRVAGFLFPPKLGENIFSFPALTEPKQLAIA